MALPGPASILVFDDLVEQAFFKARPACARAKVFWIAAERIMASAQNPMSLRDWPHPELIGQSVYPI
jgi:hypothetical protein